jgi:hypothetical protein
VKTEAHAQLPNKKDKRLAVEKVHSIDFCFFLILLFLPEDPKAWTGTNVTHAM